MSVGEVRGEERGGKERKGKERNKRSLTVLFFIHHTILNQQISFSLSLSNNSIVSVCVCCVSVCVLYKLEQVSNPDYYRARK